MKKTTMAVLAGGMVFSSMSSSVIAEGFGTSPLGQNPDVLLTIAEREHLQRLRREGKIKNIYETDVNRLWALELDAHYVANEKKKGRYKKDSKK